MRRKGEKRRKGQERTVDGNQGGGGVAAANNVCVYGKRNDAHINESYIRVRERERGGGS